MRTMLLFPALAAAAALAGCGGAPPPVVDAPGNGPRGAAAGGAEAPGGGPEPELKPGKYGGRLVIASISDPKTFNLWTAAETSSTDILGRMYDGLSQRNAWTLEMEPRLADPPQVSADGLTYTYRLRDGVVWSDGRPITADDVIFTLTVIFDPSINTNMRDGMLVDVVQPDGAIRRVPPQYRKVDDRTVEFKLPARYAPAESMFSFPIAPKHRLEGSYKAGRFNQTWSVSTPPGELVSSGPWLLSEYVPGQRVVLKRNPRFWRKTPAGQQLPFLDEFVTLIVPNVNTTTLKFRSGETDMLGVQAPDYPEIKKGEQSGDYTVVNAGPGWGMNYLGFNLNPNAKLDRNLLSLFQDVRFRRAVSHAVNRERMAQDLFLGLARPLYTPITDANKLFFNPDVPKFPYDLEKAKALLAEMGLKDSDGNGMLEHNGKEIRFNILTNSENELRKSMATIITEDLRKIGLNAQFTPVQFNDLVRRLDSAPYDWESVVLGFTGGPEPHNGSNIWRSSGRLHQWHPKQPKPATEWEAEIDRLFVQGAQELDPAKRREIYGRWQVIAAEQLPFIYTIVVDAVTAVRNRFQNRKITALSATWNSEEIFDTTATRDRP